MDLPALIAVLVDAILLQCPQYDRASVTVALESVFAGHPTLLGGSSISMLLGQNNDFRNATIRIGSVHAGHTISVNLPQPIDPLPAALAALASIPLTDVPTPRSDLPQASRLPFEASPHFVGREDELKRLAQAIGTTQPAVVMPAVATGLGGIGKTSLVTEFAYRYGIYFHGGVFWLNCADPYQVASQIAACALDVGIDPTGMTLDEQVQRVLNAWKSPMPRLLIFDNCEDRAILDQWKPTVGGCRVLITARSDQWPTLTQIRLGVLSPRDSRALLQRLCARLTDAEADAIAEDLGHLPLALHLAGCYLNTYPYHTVEQYRKDLTITHQSLKGRGALPSPTRHELDVEATFMLSFNQLDPNKSIDALSLGILDGAAWCAPGVPIPRDLVLEFVPDGTDRDDAVDALRRLQQLGLLGGSDAMVLHRLLVLYVHFRTKNRQGIMTRIRLMVFRVIQKSAYSSLMHAIVEQAILNKALIANQTGNPTAMLPLEPHLRHVTMRALNRGDICAVHLASSLGGFEDLRGAYRESEILYERALMVHETMLGTAHPETATSVNNLAISLERQGRYAEAQGLHERALAIKESVLGIDHPETATSLHNMAGVLENQGRYAEAQGLYERALAIKESVLGIDHPKTATSVNGLAVVLARQGRYGEAQALFEQVLTVRESVLGVEHPDTAGSIHNLAFVLERQGRYGEAQALYGRALAIKEAVLGAEHPDTAMSMNNLAFVLSRQGRYGEAQELFEQVLTVREAVLGSEHPDTAMSMNNLASVLESRGQYGEAQILYERALAVQASVLGSEHPDTQLIRANAMRCQQQSDGQPRLLRRQDEKLGKRDQGKGWK